MTDQPQIGPGNAVIAALCVDSTALERFGSIMRHLCVGLVDQAIHVRLLSADPRVKKLALGPIQTLVHQRIAWPAGKRRLDQLVEVLSHQPPTVVVGMSSASYRTADTIASALDADLVFQVTSLADCDALGEFDADRIARYLVSSRPLVEILETQLEIGDERIELIRPGVLARGEPTCFDVPGRVPTVLCTSQFRKDSGIDRLIQAVGLLRDRKVEVLLFLLGQGPEEARLRRMVRARKLSARIAFAHPLGDPARALVGADIFVRPSADKTFFAGSLQAMAAGMAVVTLPNVATDHLRHNETAFVCADSKPAAFADAIQQLVTDREFARRMAVQAQEYVRTHHAMSKMGDLASAVFRALNLSRTTLSIAR